MKLLLPITLLAAAVSAQSSTAVSTEDSGKCLAAYIVDRCLQTESPRAEACSTSDYVCLCRAYQAIATCYNNCPDDVRGPQARNQATFYCSQVTTVSGNTTMPMTSMPAPTADSTDAPPAPGDVVAGTATIDVAQPDSTGAAGALGLNAGGVLMGFAGAAAALL